MLRGTRQGKRVRRQIKIVHRASEIEEDDPGVWPPSESTCEIVKDAMVLQGCAAALSLDI